MALSIGPASAQTPSGFTIAVSQGTIPSGWWYDAIYVVAKNEGASMSEPTSFGSGSGQYLWSTTIVAAPVTSVTVTGLPEQGRQYHVLAFRHFSDATPTERATVTHGNAIEQYCTQEYTYRHVPRTSITDDWSQGHQLWTTDQYWMPETKYYEVSSDGTVGSKFSNITGGTPIKSRFGWRHDAAWTASTYIKQRTAQPWASLTVMTSEAEYIQIYTSGGGIAITEYQGGAYQLFGLATQALDSWKRFEIRHDGSGGMTYWYNNSQVASHTFNFSCGPLTAWLGEVSSPAATTDYGPLTVTGDFNIWGWTCAGANRGFRGGPYGIYAGAEGTTGFFTDAGGITVPNVNSATYMGSPQHNNSPYSHAAGSATVLSPILYPAPGYKFGALKLAGRTNSNGSLLAKVYDQTGTLVPDAQITSNSTGFTPTGTGVSSVDLSSVQAQGIYVSLAVTNSSTNSRPPVWQNCAVTFTAGARPTTRKTIGRRGGVR